MNVKEASEADLTAVDGITDEIAKAIVSSRDNIRTVAHLLDVRASSNNQNNPNNNNSNNSPNGNSPNSNNQNNNGNNNNNGEKLISSELLRQIAPYVTTKGETVTPGLININLASREVLATVPGLTEPLVDAILDKRLADGPFQSVAALLQVEGFGEDLLKQTYDRFCVRSDTYSFVVEGEIPATGARSKISCTLRFDGIEFTTLRYREES